MMELLLHRWSNSWRIKAITYRRRLSSGPGRFQAETLTVVGKFGHILPINGSRFSVKVNSGYPLMLIR